MPSALTVMRRLGRLLYLFALCAVFARTTVAGASAASTAASAASFDIVVPVLAAPPSQAGLIDATWATAPRVTLDRDFTNRRAAGEPTTVAIAQDATSLDVAFDVTQREMLQQSTSTNGAGVTSDDYVGVFLSPNGPVGFQYAFYANPRGTRYQTSSENSAYTPPWNAVSAPTRTGYTITLRIPLDIIRSGGSTTWHVQFVRATVLANALDVWSYNERASNVGDATYFGTAQGIGATVSAGRPKPRAQIYALGESTTHANGGDTSRLGADLSLPITPTASFVASIHPDFSNVDTDQQTISPTAFAHSYNEVRPFFTQAGSSFNNNFSNVDGPQLLYTPAIPTFRDGYAIEGTQGAVTFAGFDAVGAQRSDVAETATYVVSNDARSYNVSVQNVNVDALDLIHDDVASLTTGYQNAHTHFLAYANLATESGSTITHPGGGDFFQTGLGYTTATTIALVAYQHLGDQFSPADGFVRQNDISGPEGYLSETFPFKSNTILHDLSFNGYGADYHDHLGNPAQNDVETQVNFDFSNLITVHLYSNETAVRTYAGQFLPFDENGFYVGYKTSTPTPSSIEYVGGPYDRGYLDAWSYLTTAQVAPRTHLSLEADEDQYLSTAPGQTRTNLWLERASLDVQLSPEMQFDLGARRLIGSFLPVYNLPPNFAPVSGGNASAAFHFLARNGTSEFYAVYGDPNSFATTPALFLKYIYYFGAPKGT